MLSQALVAIGLSLGIFAIYELICYFFDCGRDIQEEL